MNRRDQELLDKQLHGLTVAPRHDGVLVFAILAVFLAGMSSAAFCTPIRPSPRSNSPPTTHLPECRCRIARRKPVRGSERYSSGSVVKNNG